MFEKIKCWINGHDTISLRDGELCMVNSYYCKRCKTLYIPKYDYSDLEIWERPISKYKPYYDKFNIRWVNPI